METAVADLQQQLQQAATQMQQLAQQNADLQTQMQQMRVDRQRDLQQQQAAAAQVPARGAVEDNDLQKELLKEQAKTTKLNSFSDNSGESFTEWLFVLQAKVKVLDPLMADEIEKALLNGSRQIGEPADPAVRARAASLYLLLTSQLKKTPLKILMRVEKENGYEALRRIAYKYGKRDSKNATGLLTQLLGYKFGDKLEDVEDKILDFCQLVKDADKASPTGTAITDEIKKTLLINGVPEPLRTHLQLNAHAILDFQAAQEQIEDYILQKQATGTFKPKPKKPSYQQDDPMETDTVRPGKGKDSKGKDPKGGKGKDSKGGKGKDSKGKDHKGGKGKDSKGKTQDPWQQKSTWDPWWQPNWNSWNNFKGKNTTNNFNEPNTQPTTSNQPANNSPTPQKTPQKIAALEAVDPVNMWFMMVEEEDGQLSACEPEEEEPAEEVAAPSAPVPVEVVPAPPTPVVETPETPGSASAVVPLDFGSQQPAQLWTGRQCYCFCQFYKDHQDCSEYCAHDRKIPHAVHLCAQHKHVLNPDPPGRDFSGSPSEAPLSGSASDNEQQSSEGMVLSDWQHFQLDLPCSKKCCLPSCCHDPRKTQPNFRDGKFIPCLRQCSLTVGHEGPCKCHLHVPSLSDVLMTSETMMRRVTFSIFKVHRVDWESCWYLMLDSGSFAHVCPPSFGTQFPLISPKKEIKAKAATAQSRTLTHYGQRFVFGYLELTDGSFVAACVTFQVFNVSKPLLSVLDLEANGFHSDFKHQLVTKEDHELEIPIQVCSKLPYIRFHLADRPLKFSDGGVMSVSTQEEHLAHGSSASSTFHAAIGIFKREKSAPPTAAEGPQPSAPFGH